MFLTAAPFVYVTVIPCGPTPRLHAEIPPTAITSFREASRLGRPFAASRPRLPPANTYAAAAPGTREGARRDHRGSRSNPDEPFPATARAHAALPRTHHSRRGLPARRTCAAAERLRRKWDSVASLWFLGYGACRQGGRVGRLPPLIAAAEPACRRRARQRRRYFVQDLVLH